MKSAVILASAINNCIGKDNSLPWSLPEDLKRFKKITCENRHSIVIMGKNTFESIGKPLPGRINYVISKTFKAPKGVNVSVFPSIQAAVEDIQWWETFFNIEYSVFFIGGVSIFKEAVSENYVDTIYHTLVKEEIEGDTFFELPDWKISNQILVPANAKNKYEMEFRTLTRS